MKIGFFVHGYLPWDPYGVPRYVERISGCLAKRGHQVYIFVVGRPNLPRIEKPKSNLIIKRTHYVDFPFKKLKPLWSFASYTFVSLIEASNIVKKEQIQILHGHTVPWGGLQSALVSMVTKKPFLVTLHGSGIGALPIPCSPKCSRFLHGAEKVVCRTTSAYQTLVSSGIPEQKIMMFSEGCINIEHSKSSHNTPDGSSRVVTFVGRLVHFKGPDFLLDAAPFILSKYPNTIFQFVGDGELKSSLLKKAESLGICDSVFFFGFRSDVCSILSNSDIYVALSPINNGGSFSLLEAMAMGVPVVATNSGETLNTIKDCETGLLANCDSKDIAEKIMKLFEEKSLAQKLAENGMRLILDYHSAEALCDKYEKLYKNILQKNNCPVV